MIGARMNDVQFSTTSATAPTHIIDDRIGGLFLRLLRWLQADSRAGAHAASPSLWLDVAEGGRLPVLSDGTL